MKTLITYFAACAMAAAATLNPGDAVKPDAIGAAAFVKGEAPKEWEKDKLYILECWATWCGPCIKAIPHVNELYGKFKDKGLQVIGMNVWEEDKAAVEKFVADKGDGMAYAVAFVGKDGAFEKEWLVPAGVKGIPHAFVVKNGKYLFSTHPSGLTEELVGDLVAGGEKETAAVKKLQEADAAKEKLQGFMMEKLQPLLRANDLAKAAEAIKEFIKENPSLDEETKAGLIDMANPEKLKEAASTEKMQGFMMGTLMPLMQAKDFDKAAEAVKNFIKENPSLDDDSKIGLTLQVSMTGFVEKGDYDGAAKAIDELVATYPKSRIAENADRIKQMVKQQIDSKKDGTGKE